MLRRARAIVVPAVTALLGASVVMLVQSGQGVSSAAPGRPGHTPPVLGKSAPVRFTPVSTGSKPPTTAYCRKHFHFSCYDPAQFAEAYHTNTLYRHGVTGAGVTVAIIDPIGSPTIRHDVGVFDKAYGLPSPHLKIIEPVGKPPFALNNPYDFGWAYETTLDVEYVHAMAPEAHILLVLGTVEEEEATSGFPEMAAAEQYVADHHLATVMNLSQGAAENTFPNETSLMEQRYGFEAANRAGITMIASSGDWYTSNTTTDQVTYYNHRTVNWPASDPLITAVGGTQLNLNLRGQRIGPDVGWDPSGGGLSEYFARPAYQDNVSGLVGNRRGIPDLAMDASPASGSIIFQSISGTGSWGAVGGTSLSAPLLSGITALADQVAGHGLGNINGALYQMGSSARDGVMDITEGNNSCPPKVCPPSGVTGYAATPGFDLFSGWGTIGDAATFVRALVGMYRERVCSGAGDAACR
jgi:subtilase family serine protease